MKGRLEGKVAVVTGAGQGVGRGIARAMATEGIQRGHMSLHARNVAVQALGGPDAVSALNSGPSKGEGARRLEMIATHLAESGDGVSLTNAKDFADKQGWETE